MGETPSGRLRGYWQAEGGQLEGRSTVCSCTIKASGLMGMVALDLFFAWLYQQK